MTKSLLVFSIGPVQSFIAQARRAGDLASGSLLLSRLMRAALAALERDTKEDDRKLLYPVIPSGGNADTSLPNKLVALVPDGQGQVIAEACAQAVREAWLETANRARGQMTRFLPVDAEWVRIWERQIANLPEVYWSITSWLTSDAQVQRLLGSDTTCSYGNIFTIASRAFEARKALRDSAPAEEPGDKCSVCGQRSALHRTGEKARDYWSAVAEAEMVTPARLRPGGRERLCAVCTAKRLSDIGGKFPSVSHVAAAGFKARLLQHMQSIGLNNDLLTALSAHQQMLRKLDLHTVPEDTIPMLATEAKKVKNAWQHLAQELLCYDGDVLFPETFTPNRLLDSYGVQVTSFEAADARRTTASLLRAAQKDGVAPPSRYYAILMLDGDRMGQNLAAASSPEKHRGISTTLARFAAEEVRRIGEAKRPGRVIYAGGDDVLALLPVEHALEAAARLNCVYRAAMIGQLRIPSVSAGVVFAHHLYPLEAALRAARSAEGTAKDGYNRDAVVVHLLKRAGGDMTAGAGWADEGAVDIAEWVSDVARRFADEKLSPKLAHVVCAEADILDALPQEAQRAELCRLALRQAGDSLSSEGKRQQAAELSEKMVALAACAEARQSTAGRRQVVRGMEVVARWLLIAAFLARPGGEE
jgi:CRISPR-associated protein Cmr2